MPDPRHGVSAGVGVALVRCRPAGSVLLTIPGCILRCREIDLALRRTVLVHVCGDVVQLAEGSPRNAQTGRVLLEDERVLVQPGSNQRLLIHRDNRRT
jgi:hypothetical protein